MHIIILILVIISFLMLKRGQTLYNFIFNPMCYLYIIYIGIAIENERIRENDERVQNKTKLR